MTSFKDEEVWDRQNTEADYLKGDWRKRKEVGREGEEVGRIQQRQAGKNSPEKAKRTFRKKHSSWNKMLQRI